MVQAFLCSRCHCCSLWELCARLNTYMRMCVCLCVCAFVCVHVICNCCSFLSQFEHLYREGFSSSNARERDRARERERARGKMKGEKPGASEWFCYIFPRLLHSFNSKYSYSSPNHTYKTWGKFSRPLFQCTYSIWLNELKDRQTEKSISAHYSIGWMQCSKNW